MPSNTVVNIQTATAQFDELLNRASHGDVIVTTVNDKPTAKLGPIGASGTPLPYGLLKGKLMIRADFDEPLPSQIAGKQKPAHPLPPTLARPNPQRQRGRVQGIDDSAFFEPLGDAEFTPTDKQSNPRRGTTFDDFLRAEDTFDETHAKPQERARNEQIDDRLHGD